MICRNCGSPMNDFDTACSNCGASVAGGNAQYGAGYQQQYSNGQPIKTTGLLIWSIIEMFGVAYLWILSIWSFKRDVQLGKKIIVNTIAISALVMSVNIFGYNIATLPNTFWSLTYVIPFVMIVGMFFLNLAVLHKKYSLKDFFFSQISISK